MEVVGGQICVFGNEGGGGWGGGGGGAKPPPLRVHSGHSKWTVSSSSAGQATCPDKAIAQ